MLGDNISQKIISIMHASIAIYTQKHQSVN